MAEKDRWDKGENSNTGDMISGGAQVVSSLGTGIAGIMDNNRNREEAQELSQIQRGDTLKQQKFVNRTNQQQITMNAQKEQMNHDMAVQGVEFQNYMYAIERAKKDRDTREGRRQELWSKYRNDKQKRKLMFGLRSQKPQGEQ
jgi:hypothetical protein